jgi:ribosomal-protein-alanine N-acetyltransferase
MDGPRLYLRTLKVADASPAYVGWLNDPDVNKYLESRHVTHTLEGTADFVRSRIVDPNALFLGMFLNKGDRHVGNVKLEPIDRQNHRAEIGILIGEKGLWGQNYASEALELVVRIGFDKLGLHKLTAGCYGNNVGSMKAFLKAGFEVEGTRISHYRYAEAWVDLILLGRSNPAWMAVS